MSVMIARDDASHDSLFSLLSRPLAAARSYYLPVVLWPTEPRVHAAAAAAVVVVVVFLVVVLVVVVLVVVLIVVVVVVARVHAAAAAAAVVALLGALSSFADFLPVSAGDSPHLL